MHQNFVQKHPHRRIKSSARERDDVEIGERERLYALLLLKEHVNSRVKSDVMKWCNFKEQPKNLRIFSAPLPIIMSREFQFENDKSVCWKTTVRPNMPLKMHRHDRFRVVVALQGGTLKKTEENGTKTDLIFETGKAYYLPPDPANELHADINEGDEDVVVMVCEFKNEGEPAIGAKTCSCGLGGECSCPKFTGFRLEGNLAHENWQPPTTKREEG